MRCVAVRAAVAFLAAAFSSGGCASAETVPPGPGDPRYLLFANTDLWRSGGFIHSGLVWSPGGVNNEGLVLKLVFGGGVYTYISGALGNIDVQGQQFAASALAGWRFKRGGLTATVFAGPDYQRHRLSPNDPSAELNGSYIGLRTAIELWYQLSAVTMLAADGSISSVGPSYSVRVAGGVRVFDRFYVGPELAAFAHDGTYRQARIGVHLTAYKTAVLEWSAGFGMTGDSDKRAGIYGRLGLLARR